MKCIFFLIFSVFSFQLHAQSYLIMENGMVVTTDRAGFVYDFGQYAYPQKVTHRGGQYFVEEGNILSTVDENGLLFRKYEQIPEKMKGKGINYFLSSEGTLHTIDRSGYLKIIQSENFDPVNFGGFFFTTFSDEEKTMLTLIVINLEGDVVKSEVGPFKVGEIVTFGGNYFMTNKGLLYTISSSGTVSLAPSFRVGLIQRRGGNFFSDSSNHFFTVSETGELKMPPLPIGMNVTDILRMGSHYFIDQSGRLFIVNKDGNVFEKNLRDHDFRYAKIISL